MELKLSGVNIDLPDGFNDEFTDEQLVEWLNFEFSLAGYIQRSNPLCKIELKDCSISIKSATLNGNKIK